MSAANPDSEGAVRLIALVQMNLVPGPASYWLDLLGRNADASGAIESVLSYPKALNTVYTVCAWTAPCSVQAPPRSVNAGP